MANFRDSVKADVRDLAKIANSMHGKHFFDFRNLYEPEDVTKFGLVYEGIGRPRI